MKGKTSLNTTSNNNRAEKIGESFFKYRDYTPVPLIILVLIFAKASLVTATLGTLLIVFGELIRIYSVSFIGSISRTRKNRTGGNLIKEGPFSFVRNPLYVGNFFMSFGVSVFAGDPVIMILTVLLFAIQYYFIVKYEESLLRETFGEEYAEYCKEVPPWIPKKLIDWDELIAPGSLKKAIKSETKTLMAAVAMVVLVIVFS